MTRETMSDVIVLVPGILGSVLQKNGRDVWAASGGAALAGLLSGGGSLRNLAIEEDSLDDDLGDGVVATRLMPDVHMIPGLYRYRLATRTTRGEGHPGDADRRYVLGQ